MKHFYKIIFLLVLINFNSSFAYSSEKAEKSILIKTVADPSGKITGDATVCQNAVDPLIKFEVLDDNGKAPYTFTYTINGGSPINATTTGNNKSMTVTQPTNVAETFTYVLTGVKDIEDKDVAVSSDDKVTITVYPLPIVDFTFTNNACSGTSVQFTTSSNGNTYTWNFGDGGTSSNKNSTHTFTSSGCGTEVFNVTLTITDSNGCSNSKTYAITIKQQPNVLFIDNNHLPYNPLNTTNQFNNCNSAGANPNYNVSVGASSANSNCISSYSVIWQNGGTPEIFTALPFTHTYTSLGAFNLAITAIGQNGCSTTKEYTIKNESNPAGGLVSPGSTTNLCAPTPNLQFTLSNWALNSPGTNYSINYGDGSPLINLLQSDLMKNTSYYNSTNPSLSLNYPVPHIYDKTSCPSASITATLIISNSCGTTTSTISPIVILRPPAPNFTNSPNACVNTCVQFTNTSTPAYNESCTENTMYVWNFGDGSSDYSITAAGAPNPPCHTYTSAGNYTITLTAYGYCGMIIKTGTICIEPPLVPTFTLSQSTDCTPLAVATTNTTNLAGSCAPPTYKWNVAYTSGYCGTTSNYTLLNGTTLTSFAPEFNFIKPGNYSLSLTTTNSCGSVTSPPQTVTVKQPPTVAINPISSICQSQLGTTTISPRAVVTNCGTSNLTYAWSFTGGTPTTSTDVSPTVNYSSPGTYTVSLSVTNECGTTTASSNSFTINTLPTITGTLSACVGQTSLLTGSVTAAATTPWASADPAVATVNNAGLVTGISAGTTTITYTNSLGCKTTASFTTNPKPVIPNQSLTICSGDAFTVAPGNGVPTSATIVPAGTTYTWTISSNTNITGQAASSLPGISSISQTLVNSSNSNQDLTYTVSPTSGTSGNCVGATFTIIVTVKPKPSIVNQSQTICSGTSFTVTPTNGSGNILPAATTYTWSAPVISPASTISGSSAQTTGLNIISQTLTNNTTSFATATYTATPSSNSCPGVPFEIVVTVNPKGELIQPVNQVVCHNGTTSPTNFTSNNTVGTTTYAWTNSNTSIGLTSTGSGNIAAFMATNSGVAPVTATIVVTPTYTYNGVSCAGPTKTFTIIVNPSALVNQPTNQVVCANLVTSLINFATNNTGGTVSYAWTNDVTSIGLSSIGTGNITAFTGLNTTNAPIIATITVTPSFTNGGVSCEGPAKTFTITVNPTPRVANVTSTICSGMPFSVTPINGGGTNSTNIVPSGTTYTWSTPVSSPAGAVTGGSAASNTLGPISQTLVNTTSSLATLTYTIIPKSGNCSGASFTIVVTVNPSPAIKFTPLPQTICSGDSSALVTLSSASSDVTFSWSAVQPDGITGVVTSGTDTIPSQQLFNTTSSPIIVTYSATAAINGPSVCSGISYNYTIVVKPKPVIAEIFATSTCSGTAFTVTPSVSALNSIPTGTTYSWSIPIVTDGLTGGAAATGQTSITGTLHNPTNVAQTATYTVTPSTNNCSGATFTVTVTINPKPVISNQTAIICSGSAFTTTPINGAGTIVPLNTTYTWTVANNTNVTGQLASSATGVSSISQTLTNLTNAVQSVTYTVTPTSGDTGNCAGATFTITVTVNPKPLIANQTVTACSGTAFIVPLTNTPPSLILPNGTTYIWTVTSASGISGASDQTTSVSTISQVLTNSTNAAINVVYTVTASSGTSPNTCTTTFTVTVTVNPTPSISNVTANICSNTSFSVIPVNGGGTNSTDIVPSGTTYTWSTPVSSPAGAVTGGSAASNTSGPISQTLVNATSSPATLTYTITPKSGNCSGATFTIAVTVQSSIGNSSINVTKCSGNASGVSLGSNSSITYQITSIISNGLTASTGNPMIGANFLSNEIADDTWINTTPTSVNVVYTIIPNGNNGCSGQPFTVTLTINPEPVVPNQTSNICSDYPFGISFNSRTGVMATTYNITAINSNGLTASAGNPAIGTGLLSNVIADDAWTNTTSAAVDVVYTVVPVSAAGCSGNPFTVTITINPEPVVVNQTGTICSDVANTIILGNDIDTPSAVTYNITNINKGGLTPFGGNPVTGTEFSNNEIANDAWTNTTPAAVNVIYTVVPVSVSGCMGNPFTVTIKVESTLGVGPQTVTTCSDVAHGFILGTTVNTTYTITNINDNGLTAVGGNPAVGTGFLANVIADDVWNNTTTSPVDVIYTITPVSANGCVGQPFTVTVTVNPEPVVINQTGFICSDSPFGIALNSSIGVPATTYNITAINPNGLTASAGNPLIGTGLLSNVITDDAWTNTTSAPVDVVYTVIPVSAAGCSGNPFTVTITINPEPVVVNQTGTICSDVANTIILGNDIDTPLVSTYNITAINSNGLFASAGSPIIGTSFASDVIADDAWTNTTSTAVNVVYTIVPVSSVGCEGNPFTVTIIVESTLGVGPQTVTTCSDVAHGFILGTTVNTTYTITNINDNGLTAVGGNPAVGTGFLANAIADDVWNNTTTSPVDVIYIITPVSANGCAGQPFTVTVTVNPEPVVINQTGFICSDSPFGISLNSSTGVPATTYNIIAINPNGLTTSAGNPTIGTGLLSNVITDDAWTNITSAPVDVVYTVVPVSAAGCSGNPFTVTITINPEPVVVNQTGTICSDIANTIILGNDIDTPLVSTYNITAINSNGLSDSAGSPVIGTSFASDVIADDAWTNTTPAAVNVVYTIVPVSSVGCEGNPFTVTIIVESTLGVGPQTVTTCSDVAHGFILGTTVNTTYTITNINDNGLTAVGGNPAVGTGFLANAIADDVWNNTTTSPVDVIYTITPVSANGCVGQPFTVTVTVNPEPVVINQTGFICSDSPFGIALNSSIGVPATTYNITAINPNGLTASAGNPLIGTGLLSNVITDDAWTNTTSAPVDVVYTVVPVSAVGCSGNPFTVTITINPEPVVANQLGTICSDVANTIILGNDIDTPSVSTYNITNIDSNGLTASAGSPLIGTGFSANEISNDSWTNTGASAVNVIYTIVPVSAAGCEGNPFMVTVTIESELAIASQSTTVCSDAVNGIILGTEPTATYTVTSVVSNGLTASAGNPQVGTGYLENSIADDAWTNVGTVAVNIVYTIIPQSSSGCLGNPFTITLTINPEPIVANQTLTVCSDESSNVILGDDVDGPSATTYTITNINSNGLFSFSGNPQLGNGFLANEIADDAWKNTTLLTVPVVYKITPVSADGCQGNPFTVSINVNPQINIAVATTPIICYGSNDASITLSVTGGTSPYTIVWSNLGNGTFQNNLSAGDYLITVTDSNNCVKTLNVNIPEAPIFTINPVVKNISCFGAHDGSINLNIIGGIAPLKLVWDDSAGAGNVRNNLGPGSYTVTIVDSKPCTIRRTFTIIDPQPLILSANLTNAFDCDDANSGAINLLVAGGTAPFTYSWSNGSTAEDLVNIPAGNYLVTVTDSRGCSKQAQYSINRPPPIVIGVITKTEFDCETKFVKQTFVAQVSGGVPPYQLAWSSGTVSGSNNEMMNTSQNGTAILYVTDALGCKANYSFNVKLQSLGTPSFNATSYSFVTYGTYSIIDPIQFTNTATGDFISIVWDFGDGSFSTELNPVHTFLNPKEYVVTQTVTYPFGCVYVQKITFNVEKGYLFVVPTAFTPNNDTMNDTFRPVTKALKNVRLEIYDTWGSLIYSETGDTLKGWDGKIKGQNAENGNYYCKVSAETFYGTIVNENHPFVLIK